MTVLTEEEVEKYRGLRIGSLEEIKGISGNMLERLKSLEKDVIYSSSDRYGLPFYLAHEYHPGEKSMMDLSKELEINHDNFKRLFSFFDIPRLDMVESAKRRHNKEKTKELIKNLRKMGVNKVTKIVRRATRDDVIKAYDRIVIHTNYEDWRELIHPVSKKTGAELEFVGNCLEKLFETKSQIL